MPGITPDKRPMLRRSAIPTSATGKPTQCQHRFADPASASANSRLGNQFRQVQVLAWLSPGTVGREMCRAFHALRMISPSGCRQTMALLTSPWPIAFMTAFRFPVFASTKLPSHNYGRPTSAATLEHEMGLLSRFRNLTLAERPAQIRAPDS